MTTEASKTLNDLYAARATASKTLEKKRRDLYDEDTRSAQSDLEYQVAELALSRANKAYRKRLLEEAGYSPSEVADADAAGPSF